MSYQIYDCTLCDSLNHCCRKESCWMQVSVQDQVWWERMNCKVQSRLVIQNFTNI
jgi:hypothetical protein